MVGARNHAAALRDAILTVWKRRAVMLQEYQEENYRSGVKGGFKLAEIAYSHLLPERADQWNHCPSLCSELCSK